MSSAGISLPIVMTPAGLSPQSPANISAQLIANVAAVVPGYTASLPGSLIEDISSTDVAAIALCDSALVELVNSITPYGANLYLLNQLGQIYGVQLGQPTNTSVYCVFSGTVGFVIPIGFTVSDGTFQYTVQDGGIIQSSGASVPLYCVATVAGTWAVPANTVTALASSVPGSVTLSVTNPETGTPGATTEDYTQYRSRVLQAGLAASTGMASYMKTLINQVPAVQPRLVRVLQQSPGYLVMVGGGDPYGIAYAIWKGLFDITLLNASIINVTGVTFLSSGLYTVTVTTGISHLLAVGQSNVYITGVSGLTNVNGGPYTVTAVSGDYQFSFTPGAEPVGTYTSGGTVTPNSRNQSITINNYPDSYTVPFVVPAQQTVSISLTWNTSSLNYVSATTVAQLGQVALVNYVNSIPAGMPMNLFELQNAFQAAVATLIPTPLLTRMVFSVSIDGVGVSPESGTGIIQGDTQSFLYTTASNIVITQG